MAPVEARYYRTVEGDRLQCLLCPHNCTIADGKTGICGVRRNRKGTLVAEIYGRVTGLAMDPVEKKPLYHFHPGKQILSIGTKGCNFKCPYCQNWHISQDLDAAASYKSPDEIVRLAHHHNSVGVAYTYSEPMIWFEYVIDTSILARKHGLANVLVTNGYVNPEPLGELLNHVDAMNIDLKAFRDETYRRVQKGGLEEVKKTIAVSHARKCHVEITTLIVTGLNDTMEEMRGVIDFIASVDRNMPWHISRYYPNYRYDKPATDIRFMMKVYEEARKKLNFVYCGNISSEYGGSDTVCPSCGAVAVKRTGYFTSIERLKGGACGACGQDLGIVNP